MACKNTFVAGTDAPCNIRLGFAWYYLRLKEVGTGGAGWGGLDSSIQLESLTWNSFPHFQCSGCPTGQGKSWLGLQDSPAGELWIRSATSFLTVREHYRTHQIESLAAQSIYGYNRDETQAGIGQLPQNAVFSRHLVSLSVPNIHVSTEYHPPGTI